MHSFHMHNHSQIQDERFHGFQALCLQLVKTRVSIELEVAQQLNPNLRVALDACVLCPSLVIQL